MTEDAFYNCADKGIDQTSREHGYTDISNFMRETWQQHCLYVSHSYIKAIHINVAFFRYVLARAALET